MGKTSEHDPLFEGADVFNKPLYDEANILHEADEITTGDRQRYYGHPLDNHGNTAELWSAYLTRRREPLASTGDVVNLSARDVCIMMILLKASRDANCPKRDNLVDIAGYARNAEQADQEQGKRSKS